MPFLIHENLPQSPALSVMAECSKTLGHEKMKATRKMFLGFALLLVVGCERAIDDEGSGPVVYRSYWVAPEFLASEPEAVADDSAPVFSGRTTLSELLERDGVSFTKEGAAVTTKLPVAGFSMWNDDANHKRVEQILESRIPGRWGLLDDQ